MPNDQLDPLSRRAAEVETEGQATQGKENWTAAMKGIEQQIKDGTITQTDLVQRLARPDAAGRLFNDGIASASEKEWREWRDNQPNRKRRIEKAR